MRLKSYFARSVGEAIESAREELGPEAMLLNSRKTRPEQSHLGAYEVVFGITTETSSGRNAAQPIQRQTPSLSPMLNLDAPAVKTKEPALPAKNLTPVQSNDIAQELAELRKQIQAVSQSLSLNLENNRSAGPRKASATDRLLSRLLAFEFSEDFSRSLLSAVNDPQVSEFEAILRSVNGANSVTSDSTTKALQAELESRFEVDPRVGKPGASRSVVMFVGPPGSGKTTTIAKFAFQFAIERQVPVQLLSLDTVRVGGAEHLAAFAKILELEFAAVHTPEALGEAIDLHHNKKLILIDSPGYSAVDTEEAEQAAAFIRNHPQVEVQLVLPATMRRSALTKFSERFSAFAPSKIVYTHLDEIDTLGPIVEIAATSKLPVSFLGHGQVISQDLRAASKARLTAGLFENPRAAFSAA